MSLRAIHSIFECDGCGCEFGVDIDTAGTRPLRWSLYDIANDALRSGSGWVRHGHDRSIGCVSLQRGKHLCPKCTVEEDAKHLPQCHIPDCEGCMPEADNGDSLDERGAAIGRAVASHVAEKCGLRRTGESVKEYCLRAGIAMTQPVPKRVDHEDE